MSAIAAPPVSPFKGLAPFGDSELDALFFFGREREREVIVANLLASRLTLLYGESGVGKSSLLAAGVVRGLRSVANDATVVVHDVWSGSLEGAFDDVRGPGEAYLILDQFEEYFLYHGDALLDELPELLRDSRVNVLISLREDALAQLDAFKAQIPSVFANQIRLEHLDRDAARAAIVGPIARWNELGNETIEIEPRLVEAVLDEVAVGSVDGRAQDRERIEAPYLQLVLERIWEHERSSGSRTLRLETLRALGGAASIVRDHLQHALAGLTPQQQDLAAELFQHLVTPSGTKIAHRAPDLAEYANVPEETLAGVLATLTRDRIVHSVDGSDRYEIFHDVLVEPIQTWRLQRRLERERRASSRRQRRLLAFAVASAVALAIVAAVALFALAERSRARTQARHAHAGELSATALADLTRDPVRSLQLGLSAARLERSLRVADVLRTALLESHVRLVLPAGAAVTAASFDRSSRRAIVGSEDGRATVYDTKTGRRLFVLRVGVDGVTAASFSPDGRRVLVAGNGRVLVRKVDGGPVLVLRHPGVRAAVFAADGRQFATGGSGGGIRLWRVQDGSLLRTLRPGGAVKQLALAGNRLASVWTAAGGVAHATLFDTDDGRAIAGLRGTTVEFSPRGDLVAAGAQDDRARLYASADGHLLSRLLHGGAVTSVDFSPDGARLVTASADGAARVFDVSTGTRLLLMPTGTTKVASARYSSDGRFVVTGGSDGVARVWNAVNNRQLVVLAGHRDAVSDASFGRDARLVLTASFDGTARIWDTGLANQLRVLGRAPSAFVRAGFLAGGALAFGAERGGEVRVWRVRGRSQVVAVGGPARLEDAAGGGESVASIDTAGVARLWRSPFHGPSSTIQVQRPGRRVVFSPDGSTLLVAGGREARLIDVAAHRSLASVRLDGPVADASLGADGTFVVATKGGSVTVWSRSGALIRRFDDRPGPLVRVALSPDGTRVAVADREGVARIWGLKSGRLQHALRRARTPLTDVEFSPDGRFVATAAIGGDARIWTVDHGILVHLLRGHTGRIAHVAFSPDGRWLVTAGPTSAGLWEVSTGKFQFYLRGHAGQVEDAAFAPDSRHIVTASADRTARIYFCDVCGSVYELARLAHARLMHVAVDLAPRERKRYLGG